MISLLCVVIFCIVKLTPNFLLGKGEVEACISLSLCVEWMRSVCLMIACGTTNKETLKESWHRTNTFNLYFSFCETMACDCKCCLFLQMEGECR